MVIEDTNDYQTAPALQVYSTDLEPTPLYVFKIIPDADKMVLQDEMIFITDTVSRRRLTMVSTFFSSSSKIDGTVVSGHNMNLIFLLLDHFLLLYDKSLKELSGVTI